MCHSGTLRSEMQRNGGKDQTETRTMRVWKTLMMKNLRGCLVGLEIDSFSLFFKVSCEKPDQSFVSSDAYEGDSFFTEFTDDDLDFAGYVQYCLHC